MAVAEAPPRTRARKRTPAVTVTPEDFVRVVRYLDTQVLVERALELRMLTLTTLSGVNQHQLGGAGIAKSLALREWAKCITDARYFEKPMNPTLTPDAVIGGYDMPRYAKTGEFVRKVDGYAPTAHVIFIDEWFRANGAMLDALLPLANTEERMAEHNGGMMKCPTLMLVSASNTLPDPDNVQALALVDRITLMLYVEDVKADESFKEVFRRHHERRQAERAGVTTRETVTLAQVQEAQRQVDAVKLSAEFLDEAADLRRRVKAEGLAVSPRRWMELGRVLRFAPCATPRPPANGCRTRC
jgi:MoxR-like ATPase